MKLDKLLVSDTAHDVHWLVDSHGIHTVQYGKQTTTGLDDIEAAKEYGYCIRHALECLGLFD